MDPIFLLHGALGEADQFDKLAPLLAPHFQVHRFDLEGHGRRPLGEDQFSTAGFCNNLAAALDEVGVEQANLFGYSMGGYVASAFAHAQPQRVRRIFTLATKFVWSPQIADKETRMLNADTIEAKLPRFAEALATRHTALGMRQILAKTADYLRTLGNEGGLREKMPDLQLPFRVGIGDRDTMVGAEEARDIFKILPHGQLQVFPGTPHPFEKVDPSILAAAVIQFFQAP